MRKALVVSASTVLAMVCGSAGELRACATSSSGFAGPPIQLQNPLALPGVQPPPPGNGQSIFSAPVDLFGPTSPMTCACGIGLGSTASGLPSSVNVSQVIFSRFNPQTGQNTVVTEMLPLSLSSVVSQALASGPGQLFPGATWFGFSGSILPYVEPLLPGPEFFTINFVVNGPPADLAALTGLPVQFAAGVGDPRTGLPNFQDPVHPVTYFSGSSVPPCVPTDTALCLQDDRFHVGVEWRNRGTIPFRPAKVARCGSDTSGIFFFNNPDNWEFLFKMVPGCRLNQHHWVFSAATTNVEFMLTVEDTQTGIVREYSNPLGNPAPPIQDVRAFATCP